MENWQNTSKGLALNLSDFQSEIASINIRQRIYSFTSQVKTSFSYDTNLAMAEMLVYDNKKITE